MIVLGNGMCKFTVILCILKIFRTFSHALKTNVVSTYIKTSFF